MALSVCASSSFYKQVSGLGLHQNKATSHSLLWRDAYAPARPLLQRQAAGRALRPSPVVQAMATPEQLHNVLKATAVFAKTSSIIALGATTQGVVGFGFTLRGMPFSVYIGAAFGAIAVPLFYTTAATCMGESNAVMAAITLATIIHLIAWNIAINKDF